MSSTAKAKQPLAPLTDELIESGEDLCSYMKAARAVPPAGRSRTNENTSEGPKPTNESERAMRQARCKLPRRKREVPDLDFPQ